MPSKCATTTDADAAAEAAAGHGRTFWPWVGSDKTCQRGDRIL